MATVFAARAEPEAPPMGNMDFDGDGSLAEVMHEVGVALEADSLVVAWHERDGNQPVLLFTDGMDAAHHAAERALIERTNLTIGAPDAPIRTEWRVADGDGLGGELTTSISTTTGVVMITSRFNRLGQSTRVRARDTVMRLLPMVRPFIRQWSARITAMTRLRGLTAAVNRSDVGILLVNRHGHLLFANAAAETLIAQNDGIRRQGSLLSGGRLADTLRLQAAIDHVITNGVESGVDRRAPVVALTRKSRRPLLAAITAGEANENGAIIYLCDPEQDLTPLVEPACRHYALTPVETRLACLLARGISLTEAADTMHVREQTARSYLKQIFAKTDTKRQAELVWLLLKSSVRTNSATAV